MYAREPPRTYYGYDWYISIELQRWAWPGISDFRASREEKQNNKCDGNFVFPQNKLSHTFFLGRRRRLLRASMRFVEKLPRMVY